MVFKIHPRLAAGGVEVGRRNGCRILLKNEAQFPWFIIIPEVEEGEEDLHQLEPEHFTQVTELIRELSIYVTENFKCEKINVGCIGNVVRQMHIHIVARRVDDPAWPGVVWSHSSKKKYEDSTMTVLAESAREYFR